MIQILLIVPLYFFFNYFYCNKIPCNIKTLCNKILNDVIMKKQMPPTNFNTEEDANKDNLPIPIEMPVPIF